MGMVVLGECTLPLSERWLPSCHLWYFHSLMAVPEVLVQGCWEVHSFHRVWSPDRDPPLADAAHDQQGHQAPLGDDVAFPHLDEGYHGVSRVLPPLLRVKTGVLKSPPPTAMIYALTWFSEGATAWMAMVSSHNSIALTAPCVAHCIFSVKQNRATDSIVE